MVKLLHCEGDPGWRYLVPAWQLRSVWLLEISREDETIDSSVSGEDTSGLYTLYRAEPAYGVGAPLTSEGGYTGYMSYLDILQCFATVSTDFSKMPVSLQMHCMCLQNPRTLDLIRLVPWSTLMC